jgi:SAM-dependent methyltransferase
MNETNYFQQWNTELYGNELIFQKTIHCLTAGVVTGSTLDLGCGSRVHYNVAQVDRWVGLDVSQAMLDELRFYGGAPPNPPRKMLASCLDVDFPESSFDTVCAIFLLHHLGKGSKRRSRERVLAVLSKAHRFLKPGGRLLIAENAARALEWPYHLSYSLLYPLFHKYRGIELPYFWTTRQLLNILNGAGFENVLMARIPVRDAIVNPMSGVALPPFLANLLQHMTLMIANKPGR